MCEAGHYCGSNTTDTSLMSTAGGDWWSADDAAGRCFNGTYCAAGMTRAPDLLRDACAAGYYCPTATPYPIACPGGTFNGLTGQDQLGDCITTPAGYYSVAGAANLTGLCAPGHYCPAGSTGPEQVACPRRFYRAHYGGTDSTSCALCVAGGYCPAGSPQPVTCPRGYYCITGIAEPEPCRLGTYGNTTGVRRLEDCAICEPGYYCDGFGLTEPAGPCDPGYYCLEGSYTSAPHAPGAPLVDEPTAIGGLCPAGGYCPLGSSFPSACEAGTYNNYTGASSAADCQACLPGHYCAGSNNPYPTGKCRAGYYCTTGSPIPTQFESPPGYYSPTGSSAPLSCEPGTYNNEYARSSCFDCVAGRYSSNRSATSCTNCPRGYYCPEGTDVPNRCPIGRFGDSKKLVSEKQCTNCTAGYYCQYSGKTEPTGECEAGYYCTGGAQRASGFEDELWGGICPEGHYCLKGSSLPTACPKGTYYDATGNQGLFTSPLSNVTTFCEPCPPGYACDATGLDTYTGTECAAGYYCTLGSPSVTPNDANCDPDKCDAGICPKGHYCPINTDYPILCEEGTFMNSTGADACATCPGGYYCDGVYTKTYFECPQGSFCPAGTGTSQPTCPKGTYGASAGLKSSGECTTCPSGEYCGSRGLTQTSGACSEGFYCPAGSQNDKGGNGTIDKRDCPVGAFCVGVSAHRSGAPQARSIRGLASRLAATARCARTAPTARQLGSPL